MECFFFFSRAKIKPAEPSNCMIQHSHTLYMCNSQVHCRTILARRATTYMQVQQASATNHGLILQLWAH